MNSRSSCSNEGVVPICGVKRGSQFLSQIDPGSSGTSGSPEKKEKLEGRSENSIAEEREHEDNASDYPGYQCSNCGRKPTWEDLEDCDIEEITKEKFEELYDNYDKDTLFPSIWIPQVMMTIPISCPRCDSEIEINVEADADIMWGNDVTDDSVPNIEGFEVTGIRFIAADKICQSDMEDQSDHEEYDHQHNCGWYPDEDYIGNMKDEMEREMAYMGDDKNLMFGMSSVSGVVVTIPVTCPECDEEIEVNVEVDADIIWEEEEPDHRLPNIEGYDITGFRVLSPDVPTFPRDVMNAAYDSLLPDVEDYDYEDQDNLHFNIPDEVLEEPSEIDLDIICETRMNKGHYVMGLDKRNRLLRPINRTLPNSCCWSEDKNFKVWNRYRFKVLRHPDATTKAPTPFPHSTEDTVVEENTRHMEKADRSSLFNRMLSIGVSKPEDIFGPLQNKGFVNKDTKCHSVGIVKCKERNITVKPNRYAPKKKRLVINLPGQGVYDFSLRA